jgi:hypothetical protein
MRAAKDYIMREIAGETILIPSGAAAQKFNGLITVNELGAFIWNALGENITIDALIDRITEVYDVDAETARADAVAFLEELRRVGALEETDA